MTPTAEYPAAMPATSQPKTDGIDALTLRALERAVSYKRGEGGGVARVSVKEVAEHIATPASDGPDAVKWKSTLEHTRVALATLAGLGLADVHRDHRRVLFYTVTRAGNAELRALQAAGVAGALPESPAHRRWREAREEALAAAEGARARVVEACERVADAARTAGGTAALEMADDSRTIAGIVEDAVYELWEALAVLDLPEPIDPR